MCVCVCVLRCLCVDHITKEFYDKNRNTSKFLTDYQMKETEERGSSSGGMAQKSIEKSTEKEE